MGRSSTGLIGTIPVFIGIFLLVFPVVLRHGRQCTAAAWSRGKEAPEPSVESRLRRVDSMRRRLNTNQVLTGEEMQRLLGTADCWLRANEYRKQPPRNPYRPFGFGRECQPRGQTPIPGPRDARKIYRVAVVRDGRREFCLLGPPAVADFQHHEIEWLGHGRPIGVPLQGAHGCAPVFIWRLKNEASDGQKAGILEWAVVAVIHHD